MAHNGLDAIVFPTTPVTAGPLGQEVVTLPGGGPLPATLAYTQNVVPASYAGLAGLSLNRRPELIISGGTLNSYYDSPYETAFWNPFLNSRAFTGYAGSRPFDYLGVHPYNPNWIDQNCLNYRYSSACFNENPSYWKNTTINSLRGLAGRIDAATGTSGTRIFVTEFGWQLPTTSWGTCRIPDNNTHHPKNCVNTTTQMVDGMQAAWDAFNQSGVVLAAQWHEYRDNAPPVPPSNPEDYGRFGLRLYWNGSTFPVKEDVWQRFRTLAGGTGSSGACGL